MDKKIPLISQIPLLLISKFFKVFWLFKERIYVKGKTLKIINKFLKKFICTFWTKKNSKKIQCFIEIITQKHRVILWVFSLKDYSFIVLENLGPETYNPIWHCSSALDCPASICLNHGGSQLPTLTGDSSERFIAIRYRFNKWWIDKNDEFIPCERNG